MRDLRALDPFVGPQPFAREDEWRFFGRTEAADEVLSLLLSSRSLLLYSQSGAGKTSLVNAGLLPLAEEEGFDILPPARVQGVVPAGTPLGEMGNPYTFFTLASFDPIGRDGLGYDSIAEALRARPRPLDRFGDPAQRLIVLDQFEELFTSFPEHWQHRPRFVEDLAVALAEDPCLHVLFCLREDHLADMLSLARLLPDRLRTRFRLSRLRYSEAASAIEGPVTATSVSFADGVVARLVNDLMQIRVETTPGTATEMPGEFIEPVQLQVVCTSLWRSLPPETQEITDEHVRRFGDVSTALARFYEDAVAETARRTGLPEGSVRDWFQSTLITPGNTRGMAYQGATSTAGLDNRAVRILEDRHMVRAEVRAGSRWYELTHDRFIGPIQASNARAAELDAASRRYWGIAPVLLAVVGAAVLALDGSNRGAMEALARFVLGGTAAVGLVQLASVELERRRRQRRFLSWLTRGPALIVGLLFIAGALGMLVDAPEASAAFSFSEYLATNAPGLDPPSEVNCGGSTLSVFVDGPSPTVSPHARTSLDLKALAGTWCASEASGSMIFIPVMLWLGIAMSFIASSALWRRRHPRGTGRRRIPEAAGR